MHAGSIISRYQVGEDGKTAHRRLKGKDFKKEVAEFGECVWYLRARSKEQDKLESRWDTGMWLGILDWIHRKK